MSDSYDLGSLHRAAADGDHLAQRRLDQIAFEVYLNTLNTIRECDARGRLEQLAASLTEPLEMDVLELPERGLDVLARGGHPGAKGFLLGVARGTSGADRFFQRSGVFHGEVRRELGRGGDDGGGSLQLVQGEGFGFQDGVQAPFGLDGRGPQRGDETPQLAMRDDGFASSFLGVQRQVVVDDQIDVLDVQATRGDVRGHQQLELAVLELVDELQPLLL